MTSSLRIGRVAGIEIGINWSWLIVAVLITWSLAAAVFPDQNPGLGEGTYLAMAIVAALGFFASIILHELGHAIEAKRQGMEIAGITLWLFGGVARFEGTFPNARAELRIAAAGPLVSLVLGVVLSGAAALLSLPTEVSGVVAWLGYINLVLLLFNLLPALPLDGGRILRAMLWRRRGSFLDATRTSAGIARGFGMFLITAGLFLFIFAGAFGGAWLAFIGWFLLAAAESELRAATTRGVLADLTVGDVMVGEPVTVRPDMSLREFIEERFARHRHAAYPVVDADRRPLGLISFRSVAEVDPEAWASRRVGDHMEPTERVITVRPDDELASVFADLATSRLNRALVCHDGALAGLLSITDVVRMIELRSLDAPGAAEFGGYRPPSASRASGPPMAAPPPASSGRARPGA